MEKDIKGNNREPFQSVMDCTACKTLSKITGKKLCCCANDLSSLNKEIECNPNNTIDTITWLIQIILIPMDEEDNYIKEPRKFYWTPEKLEYSFVDFLNQTVLGLDDYEGAIGKLDKLFCSSFGRCQDFRPILKALIEGKEYPKNKNEKVEQLYESFQEQLESDLLEDLFLSSAITNEEFDLSNLENDIIDKLKNSAAVKSTKDFLKDLTKEESKDIFKYIIDIGGDKLMRFLSDGNYKCFNWRVNRLTTDENKAMHFSCQKSCTTYLEYYSDLIQKNVNLICNLLYTSDEQPEANVKMIINMVKCGGRLNLQ